MRYLVYSLAGFLSGSVMYSQLLPYLASGTDITAVSDDGNPGCSNVFKLCGTPLGILCLLCDLLKGSVPVAFCLRSASMYHPLFALVLAAPVFGHASSFCLLKLLAPQKLHWMTRTSGKAIAVSFGCLIGLLPKSMLVLALALPFVFFSVLLRINPHSYRVMVSFGCFLLLAALDHDPPPLFWGSVLISFAVIAKHIAFSMEEKEPLRLYFGLRRKKKKSELTKGE